MIHKVLNYFGYRLVTIKSGSGVIIDYDFVGDIRRSEVKWKKFTKIIASNKSIAIDRLGSIFTKEKELTECRDHIILLD